MPVVHHLEGSAWSVYNGGFKCKNFKQGEKREVTKELADYLVSTFPGCFAIVKAQAIEVEKPEVNRAMKAPKKRKPAAKKAPAKKAPAKKGKA